MRDRGVIRAPELQLSVPREHTYCHPRCINMQDNRRGNTEIQDKTMSHALGKGNTNIRKRFIYFSIFSGDTFFQLHFSSTFTSNHLPKTSAFLQSKFPIGKNSSCPIERASRYHPFSLSGTCRTPGSALDPTLVVSNQWSISICSRSQCLCHPAPIGGPNTATFGVVKATTLICYGNPS